MTKKRTQCFSKFYDHDPYFDDPYARQEYLDEIRKHALEETLKQLESSKRIAPEACKDVSKILSCDDEKFWLPYIFYSSEDDYY